MSIDLSNSSEGDLYRLRNGRIAEFKHIITAEDDNKYVFCYANIDGTGDYWTLSGSFNAMFPKIDHPYDIVEKVF